MKILTRDFTLREKILLLIFGILILVMAYYLLVDQPVRSGIKTAKSTEESLELQAQVMRSKVAQMDEMELEMNNLEDMGELSGYMPSYNANREELNFLNLTLAGTEDYDIRFNRVTRDAEQIRREFSLQYTVESYNEAVRIIESLENCETRCLVGNMSIAPAGEGTLLDTSVKVNCTATFYETTYGGVEDSELPAAEA